MKAIAKTANENIFVEMTAQEFQHITGRLPVMDNYSKTLDTREYPLSEVMYEMDKLRRRRNAMRLAAAELGALQTLLASTLDEVDRMVEPEPEAEAAT